MNSSMDSGAWHPRMRSHGTRTEVYPSHYVEFYCGLQVLGRMRVYCLLSLFLSRKSTEPNHLNIQTLRIHQNELPSILEPGNR